jgi:hypothetical protein
MRVSLRLCSAVQPRKPSIHFLGRRTPSRSSSLPFRSISNRSQSPPTSQCTSQNDSDASPTLPTHDTLLVCHNIVYPNVPQTPLNNLSDTMTCPGYCQLCWPTSWPRPCTLLPNHHYHHNANPCYFHDHGNASGRVHSGTPPGLPSVRPARDQGPLRRVRGQNPSYHPTTIRIRTNSRCRWC